MARTDESGSRWAVWNCVTTVSSETWAGKPKERFISPFLCWCAALAYDEREQTAIRIQPGHRLRRVEQGMTTLSYQLLAISYRPETARLTGLWRSPSHRRACAASSGARRNPGADGRRPYVAVAQAADGDSPIAC